MTTTHQPSSLVPRAADASPAARPRPGMVQASVLTAAATILAIALTAAFGRLGLLVAAISFAVPLFLLWCAADVVRE